MNPIIRCKKHVLSSTSFDIFTEWKDGFVTITDKQAVKFGVDTGTGKRHKHRKIRSLEKKCIVRCPKKQSRPQAPLYLMVR